jgi:hypothetical protein
LFRRTVEFCGFPPISQRTKNGWGTEMMSE